MSAAAAEGEIARQETNEAFPDSAGEISAAGAASLDQTDLPVIILGNPEFHATDPGQVALAAGKPQLVEFFAYWCAVCKALAPAIHGLENMYDDQINFVYLNRDDPATQSLQQELGYIYQPHFFLLDANGAILQQWRGYVDGVVIQRALVSVLGY